MFSKPDDTFRPRSDTNCDKLLEIVETMAARRYYERSADETAPPLPRCREARTTSRSC